MEPKIIKEETIERDSNTLDESVVNNNNNKESVFRIHTRKYLYLKVLRNQYTFTSEIFLNSSIVLFC